MTDNIREKLKNLPEDSGVYVMLDENKSIIYIGKARVLKNRVRQYFHSAASFNDKTLAMVSRIRDFHYYITPSESDALALEANLVKKHKPPYNILLKDDKNFPGIRLDMEEDFPKFTLTRRIKKDGARYFGPYMGGVRVRDILDIISSAYGIRQCSLNFGKSTKPRRPCLDYQIGKCSGACAGLVSKEEYRQSVLRAAEFLSGRDTEIKQLLTQKMTDAAQREQYETAAVYRDRLQMVEKLKQSKIALLSKSVNMDVLGYRFDGRYGAVSVLIVRDGKMEGVQNYPVSDAALDAEDTFESFISQYYADSAYQPELVLCPGLIEVEAVEQYLSELFNKKVRVEIPQRGVKKRLVDMADKNAAEYMEKYLEKIKHKEALTMGAVSVLESELGLKKPPLRIECYDISHMSGEQKAASMTVFIGGQKQPAHYRRFKVNVPGNDDFASMAEVIRRRFSRIGESEEDVSFSQMPSLVVIDGGKGQLKYAVEALRQLGMEDLVEVIALAERKDEVYLPGNSRAVLLSRSSLGLRLLQSIRDEAHRFGLSYHRKLRDKRITGELDNIPGIGSARKKLLLSHFKGMDGIKKASKEQLAEVSGLSRTAAAAVYRHFNGREDD